ncbi:peptidase [Kitasatospora cathayae]|uniref:Peptidase n=1 Tax=Kitasatospora cathayae TaxID=3004092 RepID=A0ABY7QCR1_9ACTN|nr:peptidase [Kitasatospora sp. HUAS 3-15]WBP90326.1 peptidase [Kitasatospora sp. HUAS 3-15]
MLALAFGPSTAAAATQRETPPSAAEGSIGLKLLEAPRDREPDPRAHMYIVDHLAPGSVIHRRLQVTNTSDVDQHVDLYAGSAAVNGGAFTVEADRTPNELTTWVSVDDCVSDSDVSSETTGCGTQQAEGSTRPSTPPSAAVRDVPAHGTAVVRVTVRVPPKASAGERYAVLWAQVAGAAGPAANVRLVNRVGVRIYLDVGPGGEPPSDFQIEELTPARAPDGTPRVVAKVHNTGKRALDLTGSMSMTDGPGSLTAGPFTANLGTTLGVGETEPVTVPLDKQLPNGPWKVHLTLASGLIQRTVTATITFPNGSQTGMSVTPNGTESASMLPGIAVGVSAVALLVACGFRMARRWRAS